MIKIEIKNRFTGSVIFEYTKENNTIKETIENAIKSGASLDEASLDGANLEGANLVRASLVRASLVRANLVRASLDEASLDGANLEGANLVRASLVRASLVRANLVRASLDEASLDGANLEGANLVRASLDEASLVRAIKIPMYCKWYHGVTENKINIGCKNKTIEEWDLFFNSEDELETKRGTQEFKQIQAVFEAYKAYLNFLNNGK